MVSRKVVIRSVMGVILMTLLSIGMVYSQERASAPSCCELKAITVFADLGKDKDFRAKHEVPKPFTFKSNKSEQITFPCPDGLKGRAFHWKAKAPTNKYVFVFHEWWGLNDYIKRESEDLFNTLGTVNVIAIDLYDGKVASKREEAATIMRSVSTERAQAIIRGAIDYIGEEAEVGTIGWCYGGGWSLQAAIMLEEQATACVMFYGMPEDDPDRLDKLQAPVLGIFAKQDQSITPEVVDKFKMMMQSLDQEVTIHSYDAQHAFANPSGERYQQEAAQDAMGKAKNFLRQHLLD